MEQLKVFEKEEFGTIRTITVDNEPWFVASDICKALGLSNPTVSVQRLDDDERAKFNLGVHDSNGTNCVNECGLYNLILASRKKEAKDFKRWITHEVLPSIRRTGGYVANEDLFIATYLPYVDDGTKEIFRNTLTTVRKQNEVIKKQREEIEHKEDVIIGLVDDISLAEKRQILNRVVKYGHANYRERWTTLYREFENKFHINLQYRFEKYNEENKPKCKRKLDYIDKVMDKLPELYEIAAKLYENDVKALVEEMYSVVS